MVRPSYRANFTSGTGDSTNPTADPFFGLVFDPSRRAPGRSRPTATICSAAIPAPRRYIGWQTFFDLGDGQVKNNKKVDTTISSVLFTLPVPTIAPHTQTAPRSCRSATCCASSPGGCPRGRRSPGAMRCQVSAPADLSDIAGVYAPFATSTPLWYYVLAEAKAATAGLTLGPVGGRIVTETLIGLLRADPTSYLSLFPRFQPLLGTDLRLGSTPNPNITGNRTYTRAHFLHYAGVVQPGVYR